MITGFTYLNSEFAGRVPWTEKARSICFRPVHYFCGGKTYFIGVDRSWNETWETSESYPANQHHWKNTIRMAVLIIPALAVGTVAAVIAYVRMQFWFPDSHTYNNLWRVWAQKEEPPFFKKADTENSFVIPTYQLTDDFSPNKSHKDLSKKWFAFMGKINQKESWKSSVIRAECGQLIEEAYKEMCLMFQHAAKAANNDPVKMAELMAEQHVYSNRDGENYCRCFFYSSIGSMYCAIRTLLCFKYNKENQSYSHVYPNSNWLKWEQSKPFFTPNEPEYHWRRLYNSACGLIDAYPGLREALDKSDSRFAKCARPDYSPSTRPSSWDDRPSC